jgi:uncharacterized membrane protein
MKALKIIGALLIVLGIIMIITGSFSYKKKEKVLDTNVVDLSVKETKTVTWPWFAGGIAVVGGIILVILGSNRNRAHAANNKLVD